MTVPPEASFYKGVAHVVVKDSIFEPSSAERHAIELQQLLTSQPDEALLAVLLVLTDGGQDHNCRHVSVQMTWLAFFLATGLDMIIVSRAAPTQSWVNPAERVMGTLNFALQGCALARTPMSSAAEKLMGN